MCAFKVEHLLVDELDYELKIRDVVPEESATVDRKRNLLRGALKQEEGNRSFTQLSAVHIPFEDQRKGISETLDSLSKKIEKFRGTVQDNEYVRLISRLAHISGRVHLLQCTTEEQESFKKSVSLKILTLEGELDSKVNPIATSTPNAPVSVVPSFTYSKPVQVHKWGVLFSGEKQHTDVISFLEKVECLRVSRGVSEENLFAASAELFTGPAFTWFMNNRGNLSCWSDLVRKLKSDFLPYSYQDDLLDEIKNRKQKPGESVTMFINTILGMCSRLDTPLSDLSKIKIILKCLLPFYHQQLALMDIQSIDDLTVKCKRLEETLSWSSQPPSTSRPSSNSSSQPTSFRQRSWQNKGPERNVSVFSSVVCWNCHQSNHKFNDCDIPQTRIFCHGCGRENTLKRNCFKCSGNEMSEVRPLSVSPSNTQSGNQTPSENETAGPSTPSNSNPSSNRKGKKASFRKQAHTTNQNQSRN
ncbi:uncharacterized protein LOC114338718 [Diabrotica virgifera virgifera]|uniref:Retrotransposon gag domain-containing protein n=1 Tax=Diabrotica virgifera virgifera TaxID=50390 RepID=A0ABM5JLN7_DIAVI|nr:uncharacterized protein LOC114338718 [Diabrotica virgifera virgifera]